MAESRERGDRAFLSETRAAMRVVIDDQIAVHEDDIVSDLDEYRRRWSAT